jgi:hypothetical protein
MNTLRGTVFRDPGRADETTVFGYPRVCGKTDDVSSVRAEVQTLVGAFAVFQAHCGQQFFTVTRQLSVVATAH